MMSDRWKDVDVIVYTSDLPAPRRLERTIRLPEEAGFADLLGALRRESPEIYIEVRDRVLRAAGRVLAYGMHAPLLATLDRQFADGGPIIFPDDEVEDLASIEDRPRYIG